LASLVIIRINQDLSLLVIFHKQLGDIVLLEPVLRKLAEASGEQVELLCPRQFAPVIELMPHTRLAAGRGRWFPDRLWAYDWGGKTTRAAAITFCREKHLLIPPSRDWVKWSHRRVFSSIQVQLYNDRYIAKYFWDHTESALTDSVYGQPRLELPSLAWRPKNWVEEPFLLLNAVSAWKRKCYDAQKWGRVLHGVRELGYSKVRMTGGTEDWQRAHCAEIVAAAAEHKVEVTDISGGTSLREFLFMVSRASAVLCIDGAASHLARAFQVPCVTLFGPSYREIWHHQDSLNLALAAGDYCEETKPSPAHIPADLVVDAMRRVKQAALAGITKNAASLN